MPIFSGVVNQAKAAASHLVLKYVARASVAVPFIIALGFALAAITVMLVQRYGHTAAYSIMAVALAIIGVIAAIVVSLKEHEEQAAQAKEAKRSGDGIDGTTTQAIMQLLVALGGAFVTAPGGALGALKTTRLLGRHLPLVVLLAIIGVLLWPTETSTEEAAEAVPDEPVSKPNGWRAADTFH